jgi:hypothetical protein
MVSDSILPNTSSIARPIGPMDIGSLRRSRSRKMSFPVAPGMGSGAGSAPDGPSKIMAPASLKDKPSIADAGVDSPASTPTSAVPLSFGRHAVRPSDSVSSVGSIAPDLPFGSEAGVSASPRLPTLARRKGVSVPPTIGSLTGITAESPSKSPQRLNVDLDVSSVSTVPDTPGSLPPSTPVLRRGLGAPVLFTMHCVTKCNMLSRVQSLPLNTTYVST